MAMNGLKRVEDALLADQKRELKRQETQAATAIMEGAGGALPFALQDCPSERLPADILKHRVSTVTSLNRMRLLGVKRGDAQSWHSQAKFLPPTSDKHSSFLGAVLGSAQLMAQSARLMRGVYSCCFTEDSEETSQELDKGQILKEVANAVHSAKTCTAHTCWHDHVKPLQEKQVELRESYETIKQQFTRARQDYLTEISALRDAARIRGDPAGTGDIIYQYEPLNTLTADEKKFMLDMTRELLKMMVETNPRVAKTFDFGQVERLMSQVEKSEVTKLKQVIDKRNAEIKQLNETLRQMELQVFKNRGRTSDASPSGATEEHYEKMIKMLEDQLEDVRNERWRIQCELNASTKELGPLQQENDELSRGLEEADHEKILAQDEIKRLYTAQDEMASKVKTLTQERSRLRETIKENCTRIERLRSIAAKRKSVASKDSLADVSLDDDPVELNLGEKAVDKVVEEAKLAEQEANKGQDAAIQAYEKLDARRKELETLLQDHLEDISVRVVERVEEEAIDLKEYAESLGCQVVTSGRHNRRVCRCANVLMTDARFCRKCGGEWTDETNAATQNLSVSNIAAQISALEEKISKAEKKLGNSQHQLSSAPDKGMSLRRRPKPLADPDNPEPAEELDIQQHMTLQQEVNELQRQKLTAEASLLVERCSEITKGSGLFEDMQSEQTSSSSEHMCDGLKCQYYHELQATKSILAAVRALCSQMSGKLQSAATQNVQMSRAMVSMQRTVQAAEKAVAGHVVDGAGAVDDVLDNVRNALHEESKRSVFWRLYENKPKESRRARRLDRERQLLEAGYNAIFRIDEDPPLQMTLANAALAGGLTHAHTHPLEASPTPAASSSSQPNRPRASPTYAHKGSQEHVRSLNLPEVANTHRLVTPRMSERKTVVSLVPLECNLGVVGDAIPPTPMSSRDARRRSQ